MEHDEVLRLYGPWRYRTPTDVAELFHHYPGPWWIAGGWAIQAFTGIKRAHGDIDPSIPRADLPLLRDHLAGRLDMWAADRGALRPLVSDDAVIDSNCSNVWLRHSGADPWEYDVILMDTTSDRWTYKRSHQISLPFDSILWTDEDCIPYLRPEIQLLHKAPGLRPQDQHDFEACLPVLSAEAKTWLRDALVAAHPLHPWLSTLA